MKFSFVFPTRGRLEGLKKTLDSIAETTHNLNNVQVLIAVDEDEKDLYKICSTPALEVLVCKRQDGFSSYFNKLLPLVKGDAVWVWGDDNIIVTQNWDRIIEKAVKKTGWDVWYGTPTTFYITDDNRIAASTNPVTKKMFCCFPLISRKACEGLGYIITPKLRYWGADLYMDMLFNRVGRIIPMETLVKVRSKKSSEADNPERMKIYQDDLDRMIANKEAELTSPNVVTYDMRGEIAKLRKAMVIPRMYRL